MKEMIQTIFLCGTSEAYPCAAGTDPLRAEPGNRHGCLGLTRLAHLSRGTWPLCTFSQLKVSCRCVKSKRMVSWGGCVLEAETCLQMVRLPARNSGHGSRPGVLAALASWLPPRQGQPLVRYNPGWAGWMPYLKHATEDIPWGDLCA